MLGESGIPKDSPAGRQRFEQALAELIIAEELKRGSGRKRISKLSPRGIQ